MTDRAGHRCIVGMLALGAACTAISAAGCSQSTFYRNPFPDLPLAEATAPITPDDCRADLDELFALVERTTPRPYARREREGVRAEFDRLAATIDRPLTRREFAGVVREACAAYAIGHQYMLAPHENFNAWRDAGGRVPSFSPEPRGDRLVITDAPADEVPTGSELLRLNSVEGRSILAAMRARTSGETDAYRDHQVARQGESLLWEMGFEPPYEAQVRTPAGEVRTWRDDGRTPSERRSLFAMRASGTPASAPSARTPDYDLTWPAPDVAMITWRRMDPRAPESWESFLDASFREIRARDARGLILDLRENAGGSSSLADPLLGRLTTRPVRLGGGKLWRKSRDYDAFLESCVVPWARGLGWRSSFSKVYADMALDEERQLDPAHPTPPTPRSPRFDGPLCVLIGPGTFSSGVMVADGMGTYGVGTLVGRPTGGVPSTHGEIGFARLPRSRLIVSFSSALFARASGDADDLCPVLPHIDTSAAWHTRDTADDPDLAVALRIIREPGSAHLPTP